MHRFFEYAFFFIIMILFQVFLFDNIDISVYVHPLVYVAFILLLPMEMPAVWVLMAGLLTGVSMDLLSGDGGLNTIASLATAFCRPLFLALSVGKDVIKDGGAPVPSRIGTGKFLRYSSVLILLHCFIYFCFETLSWSYFYLTMLRVALSAIFTVILVYFAQMLLPANHFK